MNAAKTIATLGLFLTPVAVSTVTTDAWETPKLYVLLGTVTVAWLSFLIGLLRRKATRWTWHPLDWVVLVLAVASTISTITSVHVSTSIWGIGGWMTGTFLATITFVGLYFLLAQLMTSRHDHMIAWAALLGGTGFALLLALFQFSQFSLLPAPLSSNPLVTTLSNSMSQVAVIAGILGAVALLLWTRTRERWAKWGIALVVTISWLVLLFVGQALGWAVFAIGMMAVVLDQALRTQGANMKLLSAAVVLAALGMVLQLTHVAEHSSLSVANDVTLDQPTSVSITWSTLKERPVLGSGPATWYQDFVQYRPTSFNSSPYWSARFIKGTTEVWQQLALGGVVTFVLWVGLLVMAGWWFWHHIRRQPSALTMTGFVAVIVVALTGALSTWSFVLLLWFWAALGLSRGQLVSAGQERPLGVGVPLFFAAAVLGAVAIWYPATRGIVSDIAYHRALALYNSTEPLEQVNRALDWSLAADPRNESALILLANVQVTSAQLSAQQQQNVDLASLLRPAADNLRKAIAVNPNNPANYEAMNNVLNRMSAVVSDAVVEANGNFVTLEKLEPSSPIHDVGEGETLLAIRAATLASTQTDSSGSATQANTLLTAALNAFQRALEKKPDYVQARFAYAQALDLNSQYSQALSELDRVSDTMGTLTLYWTQRAVTLAHLKQFTAADQAFTQAKAYTPDESIYVTYASALLDAGSKDKAKTLLEDGKKTYPDSAAIAEKLKTL